MTKQNSPVIYLPKGEAVYPALRRPDTRYDELGIYKCPVRVKEADAKEAIKELQRIAKEWTGKVLPVDKNNCWEFELDEETGEKTGYVIFKNKARNKMRKDGKLWDRKPVVIDAKRNVIPDDVNPWGGSTVRVKCEVYLSQNKDGKKGVSLQPLAVQVLKLVEGGTGGAPDLSGFDEDEDGFTVGDREDFGGFDGDDNEDPGSADY